MKSILLAPNPTGTGHNMRMLGVGTELSKSNNVTVLLGSRQDIFSPLFEKVGINVVDLSPTGVVDYSKGSHLDINLNWLSMITNYFVPTFFNGDKILKYIDLINQIKPDLLISDYNINAQIAAIICGVKNIFITERHTFTLVDIQLDDLIEGGFEVNTSEMLSAKDNLRILFNWILKNTDLIITDKVLLPEFDEQEIIDNKKIHFVGSIYTKREHNHKSVENFNYQDEYIIGTVSNTTMIEEDRRKNIRVYLESFKLLKQKNPRLKLVLLGDLEIESDIADVISLPYVPDWKKLIQNAKLLISHPGWISVTEVAYLKIPTIFYLPSFMEYHEVEAYRRLEFLGLPVFVGDDCSRFSNLIQDIFEKNWDERIKKGYKILNPNQDGLKNTIQLIHKVLDKN